MLSVKVMQQKCLLIIYCDEGQVWCIPHHGVYHPRKNTLHVVFDCGARFKGTSSNGQLLQAPDPTSSLFGVLTRFRQEHVAIMAVRNMWNFDFYGGLKAISQEVTKYRMTIHLFTVSCPSCACYALSKMAENNPTFPK